MYMSGVIFNAEAYASSEWSWAFTINPFYCFLTTARWCVLGGYYNTALLVSGAIWTIGIAILGFLWFRKAEERYARD